MVQQLPQYSRTSSALSVPWISLTFHLAALQNIPQCPGVTSAQTLHDANLHSISQGRIPSKIIRPPFIRPPPGRYSTRGTEQATFGTRRRVCFSHYEWGWRPRCLEWVARRRRVLNVQEHPHRRQFRFTLTSRIGMKYNTIAGQIALTSSLSLVSLDLRCVRHRDRISL
jgi:hypothetical protein